MSDAEMLKRAAELLRDFVNTYPQISEDEPGGYCSEQDAEMDAAAMTLDALAVRLPELERDAARYRGLVEHYSQSYSMGIDCPAEHGIWWGWQQGTPEERHTTLAQALDADLALKNRNEPEDLT